MDLDTHELAWAAGLFDGEGHARPSTSFLRLRLEVGQADPFVLKRFQRAVGGLGLIRGPYQRSNVLHAPRWFFICESYEEGQAITAMLWRWLSPVKKTQIGKALLVCRSAKDRRHLPYKEKLSRRP